MPGIAREDVEILVHVSARSHGKDDTKYRAMAQAYLDFKPAHGQNLNTERGENSPDVLEIEAGSQLQAELQQSTQESRESRASWQPDEEENDASPLHHHGLASQISLSQPMISPELSFSSVADNVASPAFRRAATCEAVILKAPSTRGPKQDSSDSWKPPSSSIADSQPEPAQGTVVFSSPTRIFERCLLNSPKTRTPSSGSFGERVNETLLTASSKAESHTNTFPALKPFSTLRSPGRRSERLLRAQMHIFSSEESPTLEIGASPPKTLPTDSQIVPSSSEQSRMESSPSPIKSPGRRSDRIMRSRHLAAPSTSDLDSTSITTKNRPRAKSPLVVILTSAATQFQENTLSSEQNQTCDDQPFESALSRLSQFSSSIYRGASGSSAIQEATPHPTKRSYAELEIVPSSADVQNQAEVSSPQDLPTRSFKRQNIAEMSIVEDTQIQSSSPATAPTPSATTMKLESVWSEALEIHPAPPATSTGDLEPKMLITKSLIKLGQTVRIVHLPSELIREPRSMERGYWFVDCSRWSDELRRTCWNMLGNYVGKGSAGWGVWCARNEDHSYIRVYCWGIVVEHIYKLLYLSSGKKTTNNGLCWISADGEAIIRMLSSS